uniref:SEA domain-containing protein n=1 Tax=Anisakis simplex TaxID=6269 RepID=A0A0M3K8U1_ANISI
LQLKPKDLPVVSMQLRHVNLSARLHTNETYESYFKRRIAHMVSTYCEQQANECRGATLRLNKDNVIVLRVASPNATTNSTTLSFVVTKSSNVGSLNDLMIIDSTKIKYILSAQLAPLSRVLGGIRIDSIDVVHLSPNTNYNLNNADRDNPTDNSKLLILLAITALFLLITYIIATVKVCRQVNFFVFFFFQP